MNIHQSAVTATRAALYFLRVSTVRQAEHDVSIPDQRKQGEVDVHRARLPRPRPSWKPAPRPPMTAGPSSSA
ncbi:MAG: hypothetical protein U1E87_06355 [Alphaproteobacteria bacterium]